MIGKFIFGIREKIDADIQINNYKEKEIKWVLTVPAIWDVYSKEIMRSSGKLNVENIWD